MQNVCNQLIPRESNDKDVAAMLDEVTIYLYRKCMGHDCECACAGVFLNAIRVHSTRILVSIGLHFKEHTREASAGAETKYNCVHSQRVSL